jgi:CHAD domain-containing protein
MPAFAKIQLDAQLKRVEKEWARCAVNAEEVAIHDLRVSLRRFGEGLWLFRRLFPKPARKQVREEFRTIMRLSARVRDVDIVIGSYALSGVPPTPAMGLFLENERSIAEAAFNAALAVGLKTSASQRWRETLQLVPQTTPSQQALAAPDEVAPVTPVPAEDTAGDPQP